MQIVNFHKHTLTHNTYAHTLALRPVFFCEFYTLLIATVNDYSVLLYLLPLSIFFLLLLLFAQTERLLIHTNCNPIDNYDIHEIGKIKLYIPAIAPYSNFLLFIILCCWHGFLMNRMTLGKKKNWERVFERATLNQFF